MLKRCVLLSLILFVPLSAAEGQQSTRRKMEIEDLYRFERLSDPQISPDGKWVAYVSTDVSLEKNSSTSHLWLVATHGGGPKRLTQKGTGNFHPRWSPDSKQIVYQSNQSGSSQLWIVDVASGKTTRLTDIATGAAGGIWSPDGNWIAFVSSVYAEYSMKPYSVSNSLNKKRIEAEKKNPVNARVFDRLFFRHWNHYLDGKREHLFVIPASGGEPRDVTPFDRDSNPISFTFSGGDDFTFTTDSKYLVYTAAPKRDEAWSTNYDLCKVSIIGGEVECLTKENLAADGLPRFSPDGKWLAYRAQQTAGYEADRWQLYIIDATRDGKKKSLTANFDSSVEDFVWGTDCKTIYFLSEKNARTPIFEVRVTNGAIKQVKDKHSHRTLSFSSNGKVLAFGRAAMTFPTDVFVWDLRNKERQVTHANQKLLSNLSLPAPESVTVKGAGGTPMQMWILKPPGFDPKKKWPLIYMVHGGPQGAWIDSWHYRWNPQVWAAQGYVIALPNPRGSTGFGQKYVEEISGDWGGKCFEDLMNGVEYMEKQPYIDTTRLAAAGASFGGYMMNWFQGHTTKFKTLITHCGVYNLESMYGTTEELWFVEWDLGGKPWTKPENYRKFSPHLYAKNFKTPMLIIHGELDFRVPVSEGLQMFTTLQRLGVPSKMIVFPDEGHFVSKPRNNQFWHQQIFAWLKKYAPPGGR